MVRHSGLVLVVLTVRMQAVDIALALMAVGIGLVVLLLSSQTSRLESISNGVRCSSSKVMNACFVARSKPRWMAGMILACRPAD
jgi:hypothetical protein